MLRVKGGSTHHSTFCSLKGAVLSVCAPALFPFPFFPLIGNGVIASLGIAGPWNGIVNGGTVIGGSESQNQSVTYGTVRVNVFLAIWREGDAKTDHNNKIDLKDIQMTTV